MEKQECFFCHRGGGFASEFLQWSWGDDYLRSQGFDEKENSSGENQ
jgi:hypothetical protein